ncbi:hypothetical protein [Roseinatronobacter monicus]|uniref:Uncharacterized protein n=1 Tax=Roseinatronobacter monicus TaxID=393481 RepID=A0A543K626_9RHOB|nr:hypothetical protein [Roseinatronobacter monicus]TQM90530.1 hypothetical protein BD293_3923 [Roseinatronobacter monicus]
MNARACNDPLQRCDSGNLFRLNAANLNTSVEGIVNGNSTGPLPDGRVYKLSNTLAGTRGRLECKIGDNTYTVFEDIEPYRNTPEDVGMLISEVPDGYQGAGAAADPDDTLMIQISESFGVSEGEYDISTADEGMLARITLTILAGLDRIDEATGLAALRDRTGMDFSLRGTDGVPFFANVIEFLRTQNARAAIGTFVDAARETIHVFRNAIGALMVSFRIKSAAVRGFIMGAAAMMTRRSLAYIVTGARNVLSSPAADRASRVPYLGFVIVGAIETLEWYADPASREDWINLVIRLLVGFAIVAIAAVVGMIILAAAAIAVKATLLTAVAAGIASIGAAAFTSQFLTGLADKFGAVSGIQQAIERVNQKINSVLSALGEGLNAAAQGAQVVTGRFADSLSRTVDAYREMGREVGQTWNSGWADVIRNGGLFR